MSNWERELDRAINRQDEERHRYSSILPDIAKTEFYNLYLMLAAKAKDVSERYAERIREIRVVKEEDGDILIDQADWPSSHITLELAASGKQIAIKGYSTKSAGDTQWMKTVLLKLDIDARNDLHVKRDGQESTFDDIAKMIFVAVVSGSDFR